MFDYSISVRIVPKPLYRGKRAKITVMISNPTKEIDYCVGSIRGYGMQQRLEFVGDSTFTLTMGVPFIVPRGKYIIEVYAVSVDGEKGPVSQTEVSII